MAVPLLIMGGIAAASAIAQGVAAAEQQKKADEIAKNNKRPLATTPTNINENRDIAANLASTNRVAGQSQIENKIDTNFANNVGQVKSTGNSSSQILASIAGLAKQKTDAINQLGIQGAQQRMQGVNMLQGANREVASYQDRNFDYNYNQPYVMNYNRQMALEGASRGNINSAIQTMGSFGNAAAAIQTMGSFGNAAASYAAMGAGGAKAPQTQGSAAIPDLGGGRSTMYNKPMSSPSQYYNADDTIPYK